MSLAALTLPLSPAVAAPASEATPILGEAVVDADNMWRFVKAENADFPLELAQHYYEIGKIYGIRGDIALCQAILETGWFRFDKGTAVEPGQHNYCGLGVLRRGMKGHSFNSAREGVTAQIQHLYAYATTLPLPDGEAKLDQRFGLVSRGSAPTWEDLSGKWAANPRYARDILNLFNRMVASANTRSTEDDIMAESFADRVKRIVSDTSTQPADSVTVATTGGTEEPELIPAEMPQYRWDDHDYKARPSNTRVRRRRR